MKRKDILEGWNTNESETDLRPRRQGHPRPPEGDAQDYKLKQRMIAFIANKEGWDRSDLELMSPQELVGMYKKLKSEVDEGGRDRNPDHSHQYDTTIKHADRPTLQQRMAAHDIQPGVKGYRDRADLLRDLERTGRARDEDIGEMSPMGQTEQGKLKSVDTVKKTATITTSSGDKEVPMQNLTQNPNKPGELNAQVNTADKSQLRPGAAVNVSTAEEISRVRQLAGLR